LIPTSHPRKLLPTSHSIGTLSEFLAKQNSENRIEQDEDSGDGMNDNLLYPCNSSQTSNSTSSKRKLPSILKKANLMMKRGVSNPKHLEKAAANEIYQGYGIAINGPEQKALSIPTSMFSVPIADYKEWVSERRLPAIPTESQVHSRKSSTASTATSNCSVATSLLSWVENERTDSPEAFIGIAVAVPVGDSMVFADDDSEEEYSNRKEYDLKGSIDTPAPADSRTKRACIFPPDEAIFPPPTATLQGNPQEQSDFPLVLKSIKPRTTFTCGTIEEEDPFLCRTITPSESEWMNQHKPPPIFEDRSFAARMARQWSPKVDKVKNKDATNVYYESLQKSSCDSDEKDIETQSATISWSPPPRIIQRKTSRYNSLNGI